MDQEVLNLSGGELQRVAITLCLGQVSVVVVCGGEWGGLVLREGAVMLFECSIAAGA